MHQHNNNRRRWFMQLVTNKLNLTIFIGLLLFSKPGETNSLVNESKIQEDVPHVPFMKLVVFPEMYDKKKIKITGLLLRSHRENPVFLKYGEDAARSGRAEETILLFNLPKEITLNDIDGVYYTVKGIFDSGCIKDKPPNTRWRIEYLGCIHKVEQLKASTNGDYKYQRELPLFPIPPPKK